MIIKKKTVKKTDLQEGLEEVQVVEDVRPETPIQPELIVQPQKTVDDDIDLFNLDNIDFKQRTERRRGDRRRGFRRVDERNLFPEQEKKPIVSVKPLLKKVMKRGFAGKERY